MWQWLNTNAGSVQSISAVLVFIAAAIYTYFTYQMFNKMREANLNQAEQTRLLSQNIRGSTYQSILESAAAINRTIIAYPELSKLGESLSYGGYDNGKENIREAWTITMALDLYENVFFQQEQGNVPKELWNKWKEHIQEVMKNDEVKKQWAKSKKIYYAKFVAEVDKLNQK